MASNLVLVLLVIVAGCLAGDINRQSIVFYDETPEVFYCPQVLMDGWMVATCENVQVKIKYLKYELNSSAHIFIYSSSTGKSDFLGGYDRQGAGAEKLVRARRPPPPSRLQKRLLQRCRRDRVCLQREEAHSGTLCPRSTMQR